ncbi:sodium-independent sulfate anion transporter-like [Tachypleus tridentatus]|uniref:sodium-independent sulfate anion transporter-like n=1 Tax=Tachypleus tridentatus TaxID=6853 RepID=UPI003FD5BB4F
MILEMHCWFFVTASVASILILYDANPFTLTKEVPSGLPTFSLPVFTYDHFENLTNTSIHKGFIEVTKDLGSGIIIIPLLSLLEAIAIAKVFSKGKKLDATQEMIALGLCNLMGSFVLGVTYQTTSTNRFALSSQCSRHFGVTGAFKSENQNPSFLQSSPRVCNKQQQWSSNTSFGNFHRLGGIVILALAVLAPYFKYIPNASLNAMIFAAVIFMVHYHDVIIIWKTQKRDLLPWASTFITSFILGLEYGIMLGVGISVVMLLFGIASPNIKTQLQRKPGGDCRLVVKPDRNVLFPSAEYIKSKITKTLPPESSQERIYFTVIIDGEHLTDADYTVAVVSVKDLLSYIYFKINVYFS